MLHFTHQGLSQITAHAERAYPLESCGFLFGRVDGDERTAIAAHPLENAREIEEQYHRFLITPRDVMEAELAAQAQNLDVIGVYHSHPDHPARPSEFDREHALPWWSYVITSVVASGVLEARAWRLSDDRRQFEEEQLAVSGE